jgi:caffeoyl-CoA O-methyltransferase
MNIPGLEKYAENHSSKLHPVLQSLLRETYLKQLMPHMASGHLQGLTLQFISSFSQPTNILEIGTFTGFGTLCLATGLAPNGILHTLESNIELDYFHQKYLTPNYLNKEINIHYGQALIILPTLNVKFDIIFIDADKKNNSIYYDMALNMLSTKGIIIIDNVLWKGKVILPNMDTDTTIIDTFNKKVANDASVEKLLLPIRDGITIVRKIY